MKWLFAIGVLSVLLISGCAAQDGTAPYDDEYQQYRETIVTSEEGCRSVCDSWGYDYVGCLGEEHYGGENLMRASCVIEGSEDCGEEGLCFCFCKY